MYYPHPKTISRRNVLKRAAVALGGLPMVVGSRALGMDGAVAPSNRIALGFIGVGMMGRGHLHCCVRYPDCQVVAVCDVDQWRRENAKKTVEETYATAKPSNTYHGCEAYRDLRELLDRQDIDAVVIATGDNWAGTASVMAAKAGKDIYCEKPISKTIREARAMVEAARRYGRVFQIGLQQRSTPEFIAACTAAKSGLLGKIKVVYVPLPGTNTDVNLPPETPPAGLDWDLWLGPAPWRPFNSRFHHYGQPPHVVPWDFCRDFGGGNLTSNAVHSFDVVQWGLGMDESGPVEIIPPETGQHPCLTYKYANGTLLQVTWTLDKRQHLVPEGWDVGTRLQIFGALFVGERGWIHVGREGFLQCYPNDLLKSAQAERSSRPVTNHHQNWFDAIRSRQTPACDVAVGCRSTAVSHLGCIAHWTGRPLKWDPVKEEFLGDEEANGLRGRAMREPWRI